MTICSCKALSFLQKKLDPPELYFNFCRPFTKLEKRLNRGDKGVNRVDEACKSHDISYNKNKDITARHADTTGNC